MKKETLEKAFLRRQRIYSQFLKEEIRYVYHKPTRSNVQHGRDVHGYDYKAMSGWREANTWNLYE